MLYNQLMPATLQLEATLNNKQISENGDYKKINLRIPEKSEIS